MTTGTDPATASHAATYYVADKNRDYAQVLAEWKATDPADPATDTLQMTYCYGHDLIQQTRDPLGTPSTHYFHYDGQLSTRHLTGSDGTPTDSYTYGAYGDLLNQTHVGGGPATHNNYRYTGEQLDPDLGAANTPGTNNSAGLYYLRARYYSPGQGRFTGRDPLGGSNEEPITLHKYLYANADPVNRVDPSGCEGIFFQLAQLAQLGVKAIIARIVVGGIIGAGLGALIGGGASAYLHVLTNESFQGIGTAFWSGAKSGAIWGAIIGASAVNPQLLAVTVTASLGYNVGQGILAVKNPNLPVRTKVAIVALLLLQGVLARAAIQRGRTAANDPNYTANANARAQYLEERAQMARLTHELQKGGENAEGIGRAVSGLRNRLKLRARALMSPEDVARLEARNIARYGDPIGPTPEQLYAKYGSWEAVIEAAMRTDPRIDATYGPNSFNVPFPGLEDVDSSEGGGG